MVALTTRLAAMMLSRLLWAPIGAVGTSHDVLVMDVAPSTPTAGGIVAGDLQNAVRELEKAMVEEPDRDVIMRLHPGVHAVPEGGLRLTQAHTPASGRSVRWVSEVGAASISGGIAVGPWQPAAPAEALPAGCQVAKVPAGLKGASARHLWVDGVRASRTRKELSVALPGSHLSLAASGYTIEAGGHHPGPGGHACSADHGKDTPCCGQKSDPGTKVPLAYQCPADHPTCVGYVFDQHYGHCTGGAPVPPPPPPPPGSKADWANAEEVEFVYSGVAQGWSEARCAVASISSNGTSIQMSKWHSSRSLPHVTHTALETACRATVLL
eukprot:SAG31_NODE_443_length_15645_cov_51.693169_2_plen_325_part_00